MLILTLATILDATLADDIESLVDRNAKLINMAILTLPDHLVSDLPKSERGGLLRLFCQEGRGRLDYGSGFVDYFRDGAAAYDKPSGSCRFWMKLFRSEDGTPFLFVHNYQPDSGKEMTAFYRCGQYGDFTDVTTEYLSEVVDLSCHLRPRREFDTIRVAKYEEYGLKNHRNREETYFRVGPQIAELIWTGKNFEQRKTEQSEIPHLDHPAKK